MKSDEWITNFIKLKDLVVFNPSKNEIRDLNENIEVSFVPMSFVSNDGFIEKFEVKTIKELKKGSYTYFAENDIIIAKITPCMENGKCAIANNLHNGIALGSSEFNVIRVNKNLNNKYLFYYLNRNIIRKEAEREMTGASGHRRVPIKFYESLDIPNISFGIQDFIVSKIEKIKIEIEDLKNLNYSLIKEKENILTKYL